MKKKIYILFILIIIFLIYSGCQNPFTSSDSLKGESVETSDILKAPSTICSNQIGSHNVYTYEYWKDSGSGCMTLNNGATFSVNWNNINNLLARIGKRPGSKNQTVTYGVNYQPNGNSYMCVYGWTKNKLVEYYIVDNWGDYRPPGGQGYKGTVTIDGDKYDIYETWRYNAPSIIGNATFQQYWSVRQSKRTSGTIDVGKHFDAWASKGMDLGSTLYEVSFCIEGYQSSGSADVYNLSFGTGGGGNSSSSSSSSSSTGGSIVNNGIYAVQSVHSGKCLDVAGWSQNNAGNIHQWSWHGGNNQKWQLQDRGNGTWSFKSLHSGKYLDVGGTHNGANLQQYSYWGGANQKFRIISVGNNQYKIEVTSSGKVLDVANWSTANGGNIHAWSYGGGSNQKWKLNKQ